MTTIKICGICDYESARLALELGADAIGFNFYNKSPRSVAPKVAREIVERLETDAWLVGLFVNSPQEEVGGIVEQVGLNTLQFHGDETAEYCGAWGELRVMKAIRIRPESVRSDLSDFEEVVDYFLFDRFEPGYYGGTGLEIQPESLEWLRDPEILKRSFLAGGLNPKNVAEKISRFHPFGVDVASGVEEAPGRKDPNLVRAFIEAVRGAKEEDGIT